MHMADAMISPAVGGAIWAATAGLIGHCSRKVKVALDDRTVPLMGVLGAFIFAAQMINFSIPGTGSSGHLGGGLILAVLLGPHAAFLVVASVLVIQALFFADGGLLALGCNIFNLGFFSCFVAYPLIYRTIVGSKQTPVRLWLGCMIAAVVGLQLGALGVVLETVSSGIAQLPFRMFVLLMQPIHLVIGVVEGVVTAAVVTFVWKARPEILDATTDSSTRSVKSVLATLLALAVVIGGVLSWFASTRPDGLEWAMLKTAGTGELKAPKGGFHGVLSDLQKKTSVLPDYAFPAGKRGSPSAQTWPAVDAGTTISGLVGGALTLCLAAAVGVLLKRKRAFCSSREE